jgi:hypothetical protein
MNSEETTFLITQAPAPNPMRRVAKVVATVALVGVAAVGVSSISQGSGLTTMDLRQQNFVHASMALRASNKADDGTCVDFTAAELLTLGAPPAATDCTVVSDWCGNTCANVTWTDDFTETCTDMSDAMNYLCPVTCGACDVELSREVAPECNDDCEVGVCDTIADAEKPECATCVQCHVDAGHLEAEGSATGSSVADTVVAGSSVDDTVVAGSSVDGGSAAAADTGSPDADPTFVPTECSDTQYETSEPTANTDRICTDLTVCAEGQFEAVAATATTDRLCEAAAAPADAAVDGAQCVAMADCNMDAGETCDIAMGICVADTSYVADTAAGSSVDDTVAESTVAAADMGSDAAVVDASAQAAAVESAVADYVATEQAAGSAAGAEVAASEEAAAGSAAQAAETSAIAAVAESEANAAAETGSEEAHVAASAAADEAHADEPVYDEAATAAGTEQMGTETFTFFARNNGRFSESFFWPASFFVFNHAGETFTFFARSESFNFFNPSFSGTFFSRFTSFGASESTFDVPATTSTFFNPSSSFTFDSPAWHDSFFFAGGTFFNRNYFGGGSFTGSANHMEYFSSPHSSTFFADASESTWATSGEHSSFSVPYNSHAHTSTFGASENSWSSAGGKSEFFSPAADSTSFMSGQTGTFTTFARATFTSTFFYFYFA